MRLDLGAADRSPGTRALFVRGLGVVYFAAFVSLWVQVDGLLGSSGILPASRLLAVVAERLGGPAPLRLPTLLWLGSSDAALHAVCAAGTLLAALAVAGLWPRAVLFACWACYLSLVCVGSPFLNYQWDALLLETGLLALLYAPPGFRLRRAERASAAGSAVGLLLLRFLAFRLMFLSGWVKLLSRDPAWRDLSALGFHWWTQPLPTWTSYLAAALPDALQRAEVAVTLAIECALPLAVFGPRRAREVAFAGFALLMLALAATGNYGFFNLLGVVLCIPLLEDRAPAQPAPERPRARIARPAALVAGVLLAGLASLELVIRLDRSFEPAEPLRALRSFLAPFRSVNAYGLFAVMTQERREIVIEGSDDGVDWKPYEFRWKPGDPQRRPRFAPLHMPRLDWQMWFAALGRCQDQTWFHAFLLRLLEGSPAVRDLLAVDPFPDHPPRYLRTSFWDYRFATAGERARGTWWTRSALGRYCPDVKLEDGALRLADPG